MAVIEEQEQTYDPLSQAQKHIMLKNGMFEFDDITNDVCTCGHSISEHLIDLTGIADCCLVAKEICICDRFFRKGAKASTSAWDAQSKIRGRKKKRQIKEKIDTSITEDQGIFNYINQLSKI